MKTQEKLTHLQALLHTCEIPQNMTRTFILFAQYTLVYTSTLDNKHSASDSAYLSGLDCTGVPSFICKPHV